jgi:hypothetical protein
MNGSPNPVSPDISANATSPGASQSVLADTANRAGQHQDESVNLGFPLLWFPPYTTVLNRGLHASSRSPNPTYPLLHGS